MHFGEYGYMILRNTFFRYDALSYIIKFARRITIFLERLCILEAGKHQRHWAVY